MLVVAAQWLLKWLTVQSVEHSGFKRRSELGRVDLKPGKGMIKSVSASQREVQVDTHSAEVLKVSKWRSDIIESIHDGSYFADRMKLCLFLLVGVVLFILWFTGVYLFVLIEDNKAKQRKKLKTTWPSAIHLKQTVAIAFLRYIFKTKSSSSEIEFIT